MLGFHEGLNLLSRAFPLDPAVTEMLSGRFVAKGATSGIQYATAGAKAIGATTEGRDPTPAVPYPWGERDAVNVRLIGTAFVEAGGTLAALQEVAVGASGKAVPVAGDAIAVGYALQAGINGEMVEVKLY